MNSRMQSLKSSMQKDNIEALIVSRGSDIKYLTGFTGEYGVAVLLLTVDKDYFITDGRFTNQAEQETEGLEVSAFARGSSYYGRTGELVKACGIKECGIYGEDISYADYQTLAKECTGTHFVQAFPYVEHLRRIKTPEEIATIRKACRISERSFYALLDVIKPGVTEIDIANELEYQFRSRGGSGFCFETIVASGPDNGANCHATASMRKIQEGDLVTIDFGTRYHDYCSDITRTVAVGEIKNQELLNIYRIVRDSKREAELAQIAGYLHDIGNLVNRIDHAQSGAVMAFRLLDILAVIAPVGLFFGRIANFINMEVMGRPTDVPWGVVFAGHPDVPRHPSPLYEATTEGILLFIIMYCLYRFTKLRNHPGALGGILAMLYAVFRILCEQFRAPDIQIGFLTSWGLTMGQLLSGIMFVAGATVFAIAFRKK